MTVVDIPLPGLLEGASFAAQSALTLACALAICLSLAPARMVRNLQMTLVFCAGFLSSSLIARPLPEDALASLVLLLLGVSIAAGVRLAGWPAWLASCAAGLGAGIAGKMQTASLEESVGAVAVMFALLAGLRLVLGVAPPQRLARALALARRMAGAWIAVIGVLMLALWIRANAG